MTSQTGRQSPHPPTQAVCCGAAEEAEVSPLLIITYIDHVPVPTVQYSTVNIQPVPLQKDFKFMYRPDEVEDCNFTVRYFMQYTYFETENLAKIAAHV